MRANEWISERSVSDGVRKGGGNWELNRGVSGCWGGGGGVSVC